MKIEEATMSYDFSNGNMDENGDIEIKSQSIVKKKSYGGMSWTEIKVSGCEGVSATCSESYAYKKDACYEYFACIKGEGLLLIEGKKGNYYVPLKKGVLQLVEGEECRTIFNPNREPLTVCVFGKENELLLQPVKQSLLEYREEKGNWNFYNQEGKLVVVEKQATDIKYDFSNQATRNKAMHAKKKYSQIKNAYKSTDIKLENDEIMYEVYAFENSRDFGKVNYGITIMSSTCVNDECNMTKGHIHVDKEMTEVYFGLAGNGLLLLKDENGETFAQEVKRNSVHFIDGRWAHRLINTGNEELQVGAFWNANEMQDYQKVEDDPFGFRVFKKNGKIEVKEEV